MLALATLAAWFFWFTRVPISVHAVTEDARIEVDQRSYAIDSPVAGRIVRADVVLGREVQAGDSLVTIDSELERRQLEELGARLVAMEPQLAAATREIAAQQQALSDQERATLASLDQGRASLDQAELASVQAKEEARRAHVLFDAGSIPELEAMRLLSEAQQKGAGAKVRELDLETIKREQAARGSQGIARIEDLRRTVAELDGTRITTNAAIRVLEERIDRGTVHSPVSGRIGEIAPINVGAYVQPGARLLSVVPDGTMKAVAELVPADALGRVRPGQHARLRLTGFPWMQYGTIPATVSRVGGEVREGKVRVELSVFLPPDSPIPIQHGLPATCEIDVEEVTPLHLVMRTVGATLGSRVRREGAP